jgi:hypothetical protein
MATETPKYSLIEGLKIAISIATKALEEVRTLARKPGPPGPPGLGFDDLSFEQVSDRKFQLVFQRGEHRKVYPFSIDAMIYRDVFKEGDEYEKGDVVTWNGSAWVAKNATKSKPGEGSNDWRLAVKRGRDGKEVVSLPRDPNKPVKI